MQSKIVKKYVGIYNDLNGGMTDTGKVIRDAWAFGLIPETETCEGWVAQGIEALWHKVSAEWDKYGFMVNNLPPEIKEKYLKIQEDAFKRARETGWDPERDVSEDT